MSLKENVVRAVNSVNDAQHFYVPTLDIFQDINSEKIIKSLDIEKRAISRGEDNEPPLGSDSFDHVELEIIDHIESLKKQDKNILTNHLDTYAERLSSLNFEGRLIDIELEVQNSISELKRAIQTGLNHLHPSRRELLHREKDLEIFREENNLRRAAHFPTASMKFLQFSFIVLLWLIETVGNTSFLANTNEFGVIGAYSEAMIISTLNLGGAYLLAKLCTNIIHVSFSRKLIGLTFILFYLSFLIFLNLLVAHYREASGLFLDTGGFEAISRMKENLLGLDEFKSWLLFSMGCLFSLLSFWDTLKLEDPYPGYGRITRILDSTREDYISEVDYHLDELGDNFEEAVGELKTIKNDLVKWRQEHNSIVESRNRLLIAFDEQLSHLERAGNSLLSFYRDTNRKSRGGKGPKRFKELWKMDSKPQQFDGFVTLTNIERMDTLVQNANEGLAVGVQELREVYDNGRNEFKSLDSLVEDEQLHGVSNDTQA